MQTPPASAVPPEHEPVPTAPHGWQLGELAPQSHRRWLRRLGLAFMSRSGWRFEGQMPNAPHFVAIIAPHTSNWDFPIGLAAKWALGFDAHWWGKDSLFVPPLGWFMRANGGIPVNRQHRENAVERTIAAFKSHDRFALALAPEGTRKRVREWRSGFWHVAKGANVPICCVALDYSRKVVRLGPTTMPLESDPAEGIARIRSYFADVTGHDVSQKT